MLNFKNKYHFSLFNMKTYPYVIDTINIEIIISRKINGYEYMYRNIIKMNQAFINVQLFVSKDQY